ncbi:MAG: prephenate dehydrogenase, partial [Actinomycetota bacterium]|nr:prephenate dehydrogenase [Actinomycetota bacterium]
MTGASTGAPRPEAPALHAPRRVAVLGSGLLGTSIGLALRARGVEVLLDDLDGGAVSLAVDLGAGRALSADDTADHAVLCVPPGAVSDVLRGAQQRALADSYSDVASVKVVPLAAAERAGCDMTSYVGGHPMAGRERAGAVAARADLFRGRPWVLTSDERTSAGAVAAAEAVALLCGAVPVRMSAADHDAAVAAVSHAPQVLASTLAATLTALPAEARALAGQGLRDTVRLAGSDPGLWADIAACNAGPLAAVLERLSADLAATARALRGGPDRAA